MVMTNRYSKIEKTNKNIEIVTGNFFPAWAFALAFVLLVGGVTFVIYETLYFHKVGAPFFLTAGIIVFPIVWFSKKFFEFNPDTKQCRNGFYLFGFKLGEWEPLEIKHAYIAFQRYSENVNFSYGGLFKRDVEDTVFELRLVYSDSNFRTLVSGRDFQSVAMMLQLGKILSLIYNVEFKDFVKGVVRKEIKGQSNSNPLLWDERRKT
jgi:hypothetical protein